MYILNFWHTVPDYTAWKRMFDSDPLGREASGVRRFTIERPPGDEHMVIGHLEFDSLSEAETFAGRLQEVWRGAASAVVSDAGHTITEILERKELARAGERRAA
jgi:hypothetical protein